MSEAPVLSLNNAFVRYGRLAAVDGVSIDLHKGETLGLVGKAAAGNPPLPGHSAD